MSNDTAKTITTNIVPVQGTFEPLPPYECINLIGPAGTPFFAPVNPDLDGVSITNSTINSSTVGLTTPAAAQFTTASSINQPIGNLDLTNKLYVDSLAFGIIWKQSVLAATTANITLSGLQTIDTVVVVAGDRVLVKNQTNQAENGIYLAASGAWSRSPDANDWDELVSAVVLVESGGQSGTGWYCNIQSGGTLGTTPITWTNLAFTGAYYAGTGLTLTGNTFSITNTTVTPASYGSASAVPTFTVNAQGQLTAASNTNIAIAGSAITSGTIDSGRLSGAYSGITGVGTLTDLTVSNTITGSISGNAATATSATSATTATNLAGGATGSLPYQSGAGATTFLAAGTNGQVLTLAGGVPTWAAEQFQGDVVGPASAVDTQIARFDGTTGKIIDAASVTISDAGAVQNINELNFDVTPAGVVGGAGSLSWNSSEGTLDLVMKGGNVTQHIGEEFFYTARNATGSTINKAVPVYASGVTAGSNRIQITPMIADGSIDELRYVGMTSESISNGVNGLVTEVGYLRNINTTGTPYGQTWVAGDIIYVSATAAGGLTNVQPTAPNLKIVVAIVINVDNNFGVLLVRPTVYPQINDLSNVNISTVTGGDLLVYDGVDARWENAAQSTITAGKATNLAGGAAGSLPYQSAADTTTFLAAGSDGQVLKLASGVPTWSSDASGVTIADDTTTNATRYLTFTDATTGNETTLNVSSTKLQFNPSTGVVGATGLNLSGLTVSAAVATDASKNLVSVTNTGTGNNVLASSPTLTTPRITTGINDTNGNELLLLTATASAVNEVTLANAATGNAPKFTASGGDTNIDLVVSAKGTGQVKETVNSTNYALASQYDVGTDPNQIPLNQYLGALAYVNTESPALDIGTGITTGTGTICVANGGLSGGVYKVTIVVDLTGLNSGGTAGDIIGVNGTALPCYIARLPAMTVLGGRMTCLELPAGGDTDIDLYAANEGTGTEDSAITGLTETQIINAGTQALGTLTYFSAYPTTNQYLYLVGQSTSNATYTAGRFLIEIFGVQ